MPITTAATRTACASSAVSRTTWPAGILPSTPWPWTCPWTDHGSLSAAGTDLTPAASSAASANAETSLPARTRCACCAPRRFAAQLGFALEAGTEAAIGRCAGLCAALSRERVREEAEKTLLSDRPALFGRMLADGLLAACLAPQRADFSALSGLPRTPEARWTGAKLACPALQPEAFRLPARLCRLVTLTAATWQEGRTELGWKRLIAAHGWETARLQADMQRTDAVRQIESRGDCVTLRQLAVTGADLPQLCGRDVGRMLQLLLAYVLEHPAENRKAHLLSLAPQLWQRESKNNS